jgi:hypothetical protein
MTERAMSLFRKQNSPFDVHEPISNRNLKKIHDKNSALFDDEGGN